MAYQTGSAVTLDELMTKFLTFAATQGFSTASNPAHNSWYLNNSDGYWSFQLERIYGVDLLFGYVNTGVRPDAPGKAQPGSSYAKGGVEARCATTDIAGGRYAGYHLFGSKQYVHCVVALDGGQYRHFGVGTLNKIGVYNGGQYCYGTYVPHPKTITIENGAAFNGNYRGYPAVVRAEGLGGDTRSPWYLRGHYGETTYSESNHYDDQYGAIFYANCYIGRFLKDAAHPETMLLYYSHSQFGNLIIPTVNNLLAIGRDKIIRPIGSPPDFYEVRAKGLVAGQEFEVAGSRWKVFPAICYGESEASEYVCHAYRLSN